MVKQVNPNPIKLPLNVSHRMNNSFEVHFIQPNRAVNKTSITLNYTKPSSNYSGFKEAAINAIILGYLAVNLNPDNMDNYTDMCNYRDMLLNYNINMVKSPIQLVTAVENIEEIPEDLRDAKAFAAYISKADLGKIFTEEVEDTDEPTLSHEIVTKMLQEICQANEDKIDTVTCVLVNIIANNKAQNKELKKLIKIINS